MTKLRLADFIDANHKKISREWEDFARLLIPDANLSNLVLRDHIEPILHGISRNIRQPQSLVEQSTKSKGQATSSDFDGLGDEHGAGRIDAGFRLDQVAGEFRALRASIVRLWGEENSNAPPLDDLTRFNEAIDQLLTASLKSVVEKLNRYRDQFLGILGHDLRNPLSAIIASATFLMQSEELDGRHLKVAARVSNSAARMNRMISDLLDLTRSQLGPGFPIRPNVMDLEFVCRQVLDELEAFHSGRVLQFLPSGDLRGEWDTDRIAQSISNLVVNALQHGDETLPIIVTAQDEGDKICLAVHNGGTPIPPEDIVSIFEPMKSMKRGNRYEGLGLGLFIVREIVKAHDGEISVASSAEQGTTFTVRLPRHPKTSQAG